MKTDRGGTSMNAQLLDQAMKMRPAERIEFAQLLLTSVHEEDEDIRQAWIQEVRRRIERYENGEVKLLTFEEAFG
jgi:putative addiction module component (TIGR02574 family)